MYISVQSEINITPSTKSADEIIDIFSECEYAEFPENDGDTVIVKIDDDFDVDGFEEFLDLLLPYLEQVVDEKVKGHGKLYDQDNDHYLVFEIESRGGTMRYRSSNWFVDSDIDSGESYDEYESSGYGHGITEDEFDDYTRKNKKSRKKLNTNSGFGSWEYFE